MFYQRSPDYESNMRMAEALMAQGGSTAPVASPLAALARVVQGGVGGFMRDREQRRDRDRQKEYSTALAQALQAGEPWRNPDTSAMPSMNAMERDDTMGGGGGRRYLEPGEVAEGTGGQRAMIAALMGNDMTAPLGTQMQFQALQSQQEQERALALERAKQAGKAPATESFYDQRGRKYKATWNPLTQSWDPVGGSEAPAPRNVQTVELGDGVYVLNPDGSRGVKLGDSPSSSRGVSAAQQAANIEIRAARERLRNLASTLDPGAVPRDEIRDRSQKATNTGRQNTQYDPFIERDYRIATQRMVGDDPDFEAFLGMLDTGRPGQAPESAQTVEAAPQPETPNWFERNLAGRMRGPSPEALERMRAGATPVAQDGTLDVGSLEVNRLYMRPSDGRMYRWDGENFVEAE